MSAIQTDPLTGLLNRSAIQMVASRALKRHQRFRRPLALLLIDVDHFTTINHRYQLAGGDKVLIGLARILTELSRQGNDVGRFGGEEFLMVAPDTDVEAARALAERIRRSVEYAQINYNDQRIPVTVSIGCAVASADAPADYDALLHAAADALAAG